jgi:hypothetical protein
MNSLSAFANDPGAWADPARAAPLIVPGLLPETARRLLSSPRTASRASQLLAHQLGRGDPAALDPADAALLAAGIARLEALAARAGSVWHAKRVRALILSAEIAALTTRFGAPARDAALRHIALAGGPDGGSDDLHADIARDGVRCIAAWIGTLPAWVAMRMWLIWPDDVPPAEESDARVRIVRTLAMEA